MDKTLVSALGYAALLASMDGFAGTMGPIASDQQHTYIGVYGGGGTLSSISLAQLGTAFYTEANGGPLAVNAFGHSSNRSEWLVGGHVGHD